MFSLRSIKAATEASIAARIVAGVPKVFSPRSLAGIPKTAAPSIQRAFFNHHASRKQEVVPGESAGLDIDSRIVGVPKELSPTLKKLTLNNKVAVITG
jgi:hypothetical protein